MRPYGDDLKYQREKIEYSQSRLAKETGISQVNISYWENNKRIQSVGFCEILADFYGITIDELVGRDHGRINK